MRLTTTRNNATAGVVDVRFRSLAAARRDKKGVCYSPESRRDGCLPTGPLRAKTRQSADQQWADYFARFQTTSVIPPVDATGFVSFNSSAETTKDRF